MDAAGTEEAWWAHLAGRVAAAVVSRVADTVPGVGPTRQTQGGGQVDAGDAGPQRGGLWKVGVDGAQVAWLSRCGAVGAEAPRRAGTAFRLGGSRIPGFAVAQKGAVGTGLESVGVCRAGSAGFGLVRDVGVAPERAVLTHPGGVVEGPVRAWNTEAQLDAVAPDKPFNAGAGSAPWIADREVGAGLAGFQGGTPAVGVEGVRWAGRARRAGDGGLVEADLAGLTRPEAVGLEARQAEA